MANQDSGNNPLLEGMFVKIDFLKNIWGLFWFSSSHTRKTIMTCKCYSTAVATPNFMLLLLPWTLFFEHLLTVCLASRSYYYIRSTTSPVMPRRRGGSGSMNLGIVKSDPGYRKNANRRTLGLPPSSVNHTLSTWSRSMMRFQIRHQSVSPSKVIAIDDLSEIVDSIKHVLKPLSYLAARKCVRLPPSSIKYILSIWELFTKVSQHQTPKCVIEQAYRYRWFVRYIWIKQTLFEASFLPCSSIMWIIHHIL